MSDKIEREIEEILNRLDEPAPREDMPTTNLHGATVPRLARIPRRRIMLVSLVLAVLVAAGLFFGLVYPSFSSSGSAVGETLHESVGDQIGEGVHADEAWPGGSSHTGESEHGVDRPSEDHGEHGRDGGEQH